VDPATPVAAVHPPAADPRPVENTGPSAPAPKVITVEEAMSHLGARVTVVGLVTGSKYLPESMTRPTLLNFGPPFPNQSFTIVIRFEARPDFESPPESALLQKQVRVTGVVTAHRGKPQIEVTERAQMSW
jgi:hypothetical protein